MDSSSLQFFKLDGARTDSSNATARVGVIGRVGGAVLESVEVDSVPGSDMLDETRLSAGLRVPF